MIYYYLSLRKGQNKIKKSKNKLTKKNNFGKLKKLNEEHQQGCLKMNFEN